jgi:hypothetical protein
MGSYVWGIVLFCACSSVLPTCPHFLSLSLSLSLYTHTHTHTHTLLVRVHAGNTYTQTHTCTHTHTRAHTHTHTHTDIRTYAKKRSCLCIAKAASPPHTYRVISLHTCTCTHACTIMHVSHYAALHSLYLHTHVHARTYT